MKNWDYRTPGYYLVTIRTRGDWWFGEVINSQMILSDIGTSAHRFLLNTPSHFQNVVIDSFIIMPDHMHCIVRMLDHVQLGAPQHAVGLQRTFNEFQHSIPGSLSTIIRSYKSAVTTWAHKHGYDDFRWQKSFHERLLRTNQSLFAARQYIKQNPTRWV